MSKGAAAKIALRIDNKPYTRANPPALGLIRQLCERINAAEISYCHWKSNAMLDRTARGETDLDLLVRRAEVPLFTQILTGLGFKEATVSKAKQLPGIVDYYGFDKETARLVHVHAHYQLVLGHDATKNYHLPIEIAYLESASKGELFKTPAPEFEFMVFVIRMVLKHATWDTVISGQGMLSVTERQEMAYLQKRISREYLGNILNRYLPDVDLKLFDRCLRALLPNGSFLMRARVGHHLQKCLRAQARRRQGLDMWLKLSRRVSTGLQRRLLGHVNKKRMAGGGMVLAIIGGDGAGKTTAIDALYEWLSREFAVIKVHLGKPPWSHRTTAVRGILKIGRYLGFYPFMRNIDFYTPDSRSVKFPGYPWLFREVCTARDRYLAYLKARRFAANGGIVICDRFPLRQVKLMDGPQIERMTSNYKTNGIIRWLLTLEKKYYRAIQAPDLLVVLRTEPEIAVKRRADEDPAAVRARSAEIWELFWDPTLVHVIDGGQPKTKVLSEIKSLIWSHL